ncbi:MAG: mandelate racemase/muconate lactonizing enzyme family protein [Pseudomonadota bacterium]
MKITALTLWSVPLTSHETYYMASGKSCATVDTIVLRVETDAGLTGWGEVCPIPHYLPAYAAGVLPALTELAPVLLGQDPRGAEALLARADAHLIDHRYAKSALDIALWDLTAQAANLPLYTLLGGKRAERIPLYHSITCIDPDEMARMAKDAYASGIRQFQAKLGADANWEADVARLRKVREAVGPGPMVYGDWNCGATRLDATRVGRAVMDLDVMLEQPCQSIEECAAVRAATGLPMKLDEVVHDYDSLTKGYHLGCMDVIALKLSKFGGLSACRRARDLCYQFGTKMCVECTWGSDIVTAAALHLAASTDPRFTQNVCDLSGYVGPRIDPAIPVRSEGHIAPPEGPGLGVSPDLEVLGTPLAVLS